MNGRAKNPIPFARDGSVQILDIESARADCGMLFRRSTPGPEQDLIDAFLKTTAIAHLGSFPNDCCVTVFLEPLVGTRYPDIVIVVWEKRRTSGWPSERLSLQRCDFRIMTSFSSIPKVRAITGESFRKQYEKMSPSSLHRLRESGMMRRSGEHLIARETGECFSALAIIAIEAKIGNWGKVLRQAHLNTWFASHSYILVPRHPSPQQLQESDRFGIGVFSADVQARIRSSKTELCPKSYASWMLHDWAWRYSLNECSKHNGLV